MNETTARRAFITGLQGMDGKILAQILVARGYEVSGMVRSDPGTNRLPGVDYMIGDLSDGNSIGDVLRQSNPDEIYNLGAQSAIAPSWESPYYTLEVNGTAIVHLLDYIRKDSPRTKLFNAASSEMFGFPSESPQVEQTKMHPRNPYGAAKVYAHNMIRLYREKYGIFACSGILYNHECESRDIKMVSRKISNGIAEISLGMRDELELGNLDAVRDWGYAPDYCDAMQVILQHEAADDYIVSSGVARTVRDFLDSAFQTVGIGSWDSYVRINPDFVRPVEQNALVGDNSKLRSIGWTPKVSFDDMVRKMVQADIDRLNQKA